MLQEQIAPPHQHNVFFFPQRQKMTTCSVRPGHHGLDSFQAHIWELLTLLPGTNARRSTLSWGEPAEVNLAPQRIGIHNFAFADDFVDQAIVGLAGIGHEQRRLEMGDEKRPPRSTTDSNPLHNAQLNGYPPTLLILFWP